MFFYKSWFFSSTISTFWLHNESTIFCFKNFELKIFSFSYTLRNKTPFSFITSVSKALRINFNFTFYIIIVNFMNKSPFSQTNSAFGFSLITCFEIGTNCFGNVLLLYFFFNLFVMFCFVNYFFIFYWFYWFLKSWLSRTLFSYFIF